MLACWSVCGCISVQEGEVATYLIVHAFFYVHVTCKYSNLDTRSEFVLQPHGCTMLEVCMWYRFAHVVVPRVSYACLQCVGVDHGQVRGAGVNGIACVWNSSNSDQGGCHQMLMSRSHTWLKKHFMHLHMVLLAGFQSHGSRKFDATVYSVWGVIDCCCFIVCMHVKEVICPGVSKR